MRTHTTLTAILCVCAETALALSALTVKTTDLPLTPALRDYAENKIGKHLTRYNDMVQSANLNLKVEHRGGGLHDQEHHGHEAHIAEVTALCADKQVIRVRHSGDDMYASLDKLADRLGRTLRKYKERKRPRGAVGARQLSDIAQQSIEQEDEADELELLGTEDAEPGTMLLESTPWQVVRKKSFPMPSISVDEAVLCLEYIDHDFYMFRNEATDQINVVYKRNSGGVGLIEPEP